MKVVIVEDESFAAERLESLLSEIDPNIEVVAILTGVQEAVRWFMQHSADLVFLDIQLSDGLGFHIFEQIKINTPVIFTTAYDQYAIKAFKLNSVDYLLKPVRKSELQASLQKFSSLHQKQHIDVQVLLNAMQGKQPSYKQRFLVQFGEKIKKIDDSDVAYFYSMEKNSYLQTFKGASYPLDYTLDKIEKEVDPDFFFRINRKYLIHIDSIANMVAYSRGRVKINLTPSPDDEDNCIVSIERSGSFKKWLDR